MSGQGTAVVTGASSGIGAEYARRVAGRGYDVVLVARRAPRLEELATELRARGVAVEVLVADLSEPTDVARVGDRVRADDVGLLVNSAGINGYGRFDEVDPAVVGEVLVAPGLVDDAPVQALAAAESGLRAASVPDLAPRYRP